jgi:hypothetical protein
MSVTGIVAPSSPAGKEVALIEAVVAEHAPA